MISGNGWSHKRVVIGSIFVVGLLLLQLYIDNPGGTGRSLPQTAIVWSLVGGTAIYILRLTRRQSWDFTPTVKVVAIGALFLWLPWFLAPAAWKSESLWPLLGLTAGVLFYALLIQINWRIRQIKIVLFWILMLAAMQGVLAINQMVFNYPLPAFLTYPVSFGERAAGVFQQVNLLASFMATGLGIGLLLLFTSSATGAKRKMAVVAVSGLYILTGIFSFILTILQSRTGWLAGAVVTIALMLIVGYRRPYLLILSSAVISIGILVGSLFLLGHHATDLSHSNSNIARMIMYKDTLRMIMMHPWRGWGYGGFEYNFQHFRLQQGHSTIGVGIVTHPHNEFLYRWAEGGIAGLLGSLIFVAAVFRLFWLSCRGGRYNSFVAGFGATLLPLLVHTQTEYPFYLSALHWIIFLVLLAIWDRQVFPLTSKALFQVRSGMAAHCGITLLMVFTILFSASGGYSGWLLRGYEKTQFTTKFPYWQVNPWLHRERAEFDAQVASLLVFNTDRDVRRLTAYSQWAKTYLKTHIDREVYARLVTILQVTGNTREAAYWGREGNGFFPDDSRLSYFPADEGTRLSDRS